MMLSALIPLLLAKSAAPAPLPALPLDYPAELQARLTEARLALARTLPGVERLILSTSQHTQGFYAGFGFAVTAHTPDGFGPGLDRVDMALLLG